MLRAIWICTYRVIKTIGGLIGAIATALGVAEQWGYATTGIPPWTFWLIAIAALFAVALRAQWQLERTEPEEINRLFKKGAVSFQEITRAIHKAHPAYSEEEVLHQLLKAVWRGDFEEFSGHTRLRHAVDAFTGEPGERPLFKRWELFAAPGLQYLFPGGWTRSSEEELIKRLPVKQLESLRPSDYGNGDNLFIEMYIQPLMLERRDFKRWYRRFLAGRYAG